MKRTVNLLGCLGVFVIGVVLAQASDGTPPAAPAKPCCGDTKPAPKDTTTPGAKTAAGAKRLGPPYACLQYLLYDDGVLRLWSADEYPSLPCNANSTPEEIFLWTDAEKTAPQSCQPSGECEELGVAFKLLNAPKLSMALPKNTKYFTRIGSMPALPGIQPPKRWDPKGGLSDLGELQYDYVKVLGADNSYIPIKLSAGIADFDRVRRPDFPPNLKTRRRVVTIGFEAVLPDEVSINSLPVVIAHPWVKHNGVKTTFTVDWEGATYHVTTTRDVKEIIPRSPVK